ncbi:ATP-binding protein [Kitasatospora sp. NPDC051914]|uniref:ATP-binding protein n=1 Tax=Kitasatospora sp. NPDC051914 TaxID=3154945 RepID=UPI0034355900
MLERRPALAGEHACWLPRHRKSAGAARRHLRGFLADLDGGELYADTGELLADELVANAVEHARVPPGRLIWVRFELSGGLLRIEVHDASNGRPSVRMAGEADEAGRGLWLVEQLAVAWGVRSRPGGVGKVVWATVSPAQESEG